MRRTRASTRQSNITVLEGSSDEEPKQKIANITPNKEQVKKKSKDLNNEESSSSESDIENYLKPANEIDLNSSFFDMKNPEPQFNAIEKSIFSGIVKKLSDAESNDEGIQDCVLEKDAAVPKLNFQQLNDYMKKIEDAKEHVFKYEAKKKLLQQKSKKKRKQKDESNLDVASLLKLGEKKPQAGESSTNSLEMSYSENSDDFESMTETEDWEEVKEVKEKSIIPKEGVQITVEMPNVIRKKKGVDLLAAMKRRLNRIKKENQILIHKVHLLCWIAYGNFVNRVLNSQDILGMALSLIPSQQCYPPERADLNYLEQIVGWYGKTIQIVEKKDDITIPIEKKLQTQISKKQAYSKRMFAFIFICILRSLGIQCRLVMSLRVEPLRPPTTELCSLSTKTEDKASNSKSSDPHEKKKLAENDTKKSEKDLKEHEEKHKCETKENKQTLQNEIKQKNPRKTVKNEHNVPRQNTKVPLKVTGSKQDTEVNKLKPKTTGEKSKDFKKDANKSRRTSNKTKQGKVSRNSGHSTAVGEANKNDAVTVTKNEASKQSSRNKNKEGNVNKSGHTSDKMKQEKVSNNSTVIKEANKSGANAVTKSEESKQLSRTTNKESTVEKPNKPSKENKRSKPNLLKIKIPLKAKSPELEGNSKRKDVQTQILQLDGVNDSGDDAPSTSKQKNKLNLKKITETEIDKCPIKKHPRRLRSIPDYKDVDSEEEFQSRSPFVKKNTNSPAQTKANLKKLKERSKSVTFAPENKCRYFTGSPKKQLDVRNDIVNLIKGRLVEQKQIDSRKLVKKVRNTKIDSDEDSDYYPEPVKKKQHDSEDEFIVKSKPKVKQRAQVKKDESPNQNKNAKKSGVDVWVEVFLEAEEHWISVDVVKQKVHCVQEIYVS